MKKLNQIIFIDDDEAINFYHKHLIKKSNVSEDSKFFDNAESALGYFSEISKDDTIPDVILLDINMPKIDGWEFLKQYDKLKLKKSPIIIILTTSLSERDMARASENGLVHSLVQKPISAEQLEKLALELAKE